MPWKISSNNGNWSNTHWVSISINERGKENTYYVYADGFTLLYSYGYWGFPHAQSQTVGRKIESVHHLQNLYYALTGQELIYKD